VVTIKRAAASGDEAYSHDALIAKMKRGAYLVNTRDAHLDRGCTDSSRSSRTVAGYAVSVFGSRSMRRAIIAWHTSVEFRGFRTFRFIAVRARPIFSRRA